MFIKCIERAILLLMMLRVWWESELTPSVTTHQLGLSRKCLCNREEIRVDRNFFKVFPYIICRAEIKISATVSSQLQLLVEKHQDWHTPQLVGETVYFGKGLADWFSKFSSLMSQAKIWWPMGWTSLTNVCTKVCAWGVAEQETIFTSIYKVFPSRSVL